MKIFSYIVQIMLYSLPSALESSRSRSLTSRSGSATRPLTSSIDTMRANAGQRSCLPAPLATQHNKAELIYKGSVNILSRSVYFFKGFVNYLAKKTILSVTYFQQIMICLCSITQLNRKRLNRIYWMNQKIFQVQNFSFLYFCFFKTETISEPK